MKLKLNVPALLTVLSTLAGIAGIILPNVGLGSLTTPVQAVITAIGGLLVAISGYHVVSMWAAIRRAQLMDKLGYDYAGCKYVSPSPLTSTLEVTK